MNLNHKLKDVYKMENRETLIREIIPSMIPEIIGIIDKYTGYSFTLKVNVKNNIIIPKIRAKSELSIDWGDGKNEVINQLALNHSHDYETHGEYTIIIDGDITGMNFGRMKELVQISKWGMNTIIDRGSFLGCSNLNSVSPLDDYSTNPIKMFKILLIGDAGCGKTELLRSVLGKRFRAQYIPTARVDINTLFFNTTAGVIILKISDFSGQEIFDNSIERNYDGTDGVFVMIDVGRNLSIEHCRFFRRKLKTLSKQNNHTIPKILVANKMDINPNEMKVSNNSIKHLQSGGFDDSVYISVKRNIGTEYIFLEMIRRLLRNNTIDLI